MLHLSQFSSALFEVVTKSTAAKLSPNPQQEPSPSLPISANAESPCTDATGETRKISEDSKSCLRAAQTSPPSGSVQPASPTPGHMAAVDYESISSVAAQQTECVELATPAKPPPATRCAMQATFAMPEQLGGFQPAGERTEGTLEDGHTAGEVAGWWKGTLSGLLDAMTSDHGSSTSAMSRRQHSSQEEVSASTHAQTTTRRDRTIRINSGKSCTEGEINRAGGGSDTVRNSLGDDSMDCSSIQMLLGTSDVPIVATSQARYSRTGQPAATVHY